MKQLFYCFSCFRTHCFTWKIPLFPCQHQSSNRHLCLGVMFNGRVDLQARQNRGVERVGRPPLFWPTSKKPDILWSFRGHSDQHVLSPSDNSATEWPQNELCPGGLWPVLSVGWGVHSLGLAINFWHSSKSAVQPAIAARTNTEKCLKKTQF